MARGGYNPQESIRFWERIRRRMVRFGQTGAPRPRKSCYCSSGSKQANISPASARILSGTQSHTSKNGFHIASTAGLRCAASIASSDFHSETSLIVPSFARRITGARSVASPSRRSVGTRARTSRSSSASLPGLGRCRPRLDKRQASRAEYRALLGSSILFQPPGPKPQRANPLAVPANDFAASRRNLCRM
jgi:hypothetical protein